MLFFGMFLLESACTAAKSRTNFSTNSWKVTKRLNRLAPNLAHMCRFIWEWIYAKQIAPPPPPRDTRGGFRGSKIKKSWEAVKRLDRLAPNLAHMCRFIWEWIYAKQIAPRYTRGGALGKLSNSWTDWHQLWFMSADSCGNGHRQIQVAPQYPRWHFGGWGV